MTEHVLKTWPVYFDAVARGEKTFEGRRNDRGFQAGDTVVLQRTDEVDTWAVELDDRGRPAHEMRFKVGFVLTGGQFGIAEGWCVFSLLPISPICSTCGGAQRVCVHESQHSEAWGPCPDCTPSEIEPARLEPEQELYCHADFDGECHHANCPQLRDGEPHATGRHCPIDTRPEEDRR